MRDRVVGAELSGTWLPVVEMMRFRVHWKVVIVPRLPDVVSPSDVLARLFAKKQEQQHALVVISELPWEESVELYDSTGGRCSCFVQVDSTTIVHGSSSSVADRKGFVRVSLPASPSDASVSDEGFFQMFLRIAETAPLSTDADGIEPGRKKKGRESDDQAKQPQPPSVWANADELEGW
jgi:hypothetical protein